jgi:hypothetical protein
MKQFILAAFAVLSLGIGAANASTVTNHLGQIVSGADYGSDSAGG